MVFNRWDWYRGTSKVGTSKVGTSKKKRGNITDGELLEIFINKFNLENNVEIFYTDGSKQEDRNSVGIGIVKEDSDTGYQISINNKCSIYTAEAIAIEKILGMAIEKQMSKDILILSDSMSVVKKLSDNRFKAYENEFILRY